MFKLALVSSTLALAACAAGSTLGVDRLAPRASGGVQLSLAGGADGSAPLALPTVVDRSLPSVDRISRAVYATLGDTASAQLDVCIAPSGKVTKLELARSSSMPELDAALLHDVKDWRFEAMPGPDTVQICERTQITYRPY